LPVNGTDILEPLSREIYGSSIAQRAFVNPAGFFRKSISFGKGLP